MTLTPFQDFASYAVLAYQFPAWNEVALTLAVVGAVGLFLVRYYESL